jgi:hypothetical protein
METRNGDARPADLRSAGSDRSRAVDQTSARRRQGERDNGIPAPPCNSVRLAAIAEDATPDAAPTPTEALSGQERARVEAEEVLREEVRKSLTPPKFLSQKIAAFVNAPFFVAVVAVGGVALISRSWQWHQDRQEAARDHERIETEFISRMNELSTVVFDDRVAIKFAPTDEQRIKTIKKFYGDVQEHIRKSPAAEPDDILGQYLDYGGSNLEILATTIAEFDSSYVDAPNVLQDMDRLTAFYQSTYGDVVGPRVAVRSYVERLVELSASLPDESQAALKSALKAPPVLGE